VFPWSLAFPDMNSSQQTYWQIAWAYFSFGTFVLAPICVSLATWSRLIVILVYGWSEYYEKGLHVASTHGVLGPASFLFSNGDELSFAWGLVFWIGWGALSLLLLVGETYIIGQLRLPAKIVVRVLFFLVGMAALVDFYSHNNG
jgi:hypothetical protein